MRLIRRPTKAPRRSGLAALAHVLLTFSLPVVVFVLVRLDFSWLAATLILLSKWRMFAVKIRHWPANIRTNAVDVFVGLSMLIFMILSDAQSLQLAWAVMWAVWLLVIKPRSSTAWIGVQALIGQSVALTATYLYWSNSSTLVLMLFTWAICYLSARHFLSAFDESMSRATAQAWAFFGAAVGWLSGHWLIFYGPIAQPALLLGVLGYGLAAIYYLEHADRGSKNVRRQLVAIMTAVILFLIIFSDWSDKTV